MFIYPNINPIALKIGFIKIRWYGVMYLLGFLMAWGLATLRSKKTGSLWTSEQVSDFIFYCALGVVIGGRLGYVVFYAFSEVLHDPLMPFRIWDGGMAFHGGLLGVIVAALLFARFHHKNFWDVADFASPLVPLGLAAGRMGNFINGELWGRVTTVPWAMIFPHVDDAPRHPSQLYEFFLEGIVLFCIVWFYSAKPRARGSVTGLFLLGYGCFRFFLEFFREPDTQMGYVIFDWMTMGQFLSIPMILCGIGILIWSRHARLS